MSYEVSISVDKERRYLIVHRNNISFCTDIGHQGDMESIYIDIDDISRPCVYLDTYEYEDEDGDVCEDDYYRLDLPKNFVGAVSIPAYIDIDSLIYSIKNCQYTYVKYIENFERFILQ